MFLLNGLKGSHNKLGYLGSSPRLELGGVKSPKLLVKTHFDVYNADLAII